MRLIFTSLVLLSLYRVGHADGTLPDGNVLSFNRLFIYEDNATTPAQPKNDPVSTQHYFNRAHCICARPNEPKTVDPYNADKFAYEVLISTTTSTVHHPLELWVGSSCDDAVMRPMNCHDTGAGVTDVSTLASTNGTIQYISVWDLMNPEPSLSTDNMDLSTSCPERVLSTNEYAVVDSDGDGTPDVFLAQPITTDSQAPPIPSSITASGAESGIQLAWKSSTTGDVTDIYAYQALCAKASDGSPAKATPDAYLYYTPRSLCGDTSDQADITLSAVHLDVSTGSDGSDTGSDTGLGSAADLPTGLQQLDQRFVCGTAQSATATSMRIDGLENGVAYNVVLIAVDKYGNAAGVYFDNVLTPQPVTDFWEDLHDKGDDVKGGFCLLATTYGDDNPITNGLRAFRDDTLAETAVGRWVIRNYYDYVAPLGAVVAKHTVLRILSMIVLAPIVALALLWHALTLPGLLALIAVIAFRRRLFANRKLLRLAPVATVLLVIGISSHAFAQAPYWEDQTTGDNKDEESVTLADQPELVKWNVGARVGPYTPAIDSMGGMKNSAGQGPYEAMFGSKSAIMPTIDLQRFLWTGFGQLGVGLSVSYMGKTAHAYTNGSDPNSPSRPRSDGDETSFRMVPIELTATYRASFIDDEFNIPVFPYIRGGFGYYVWWMTAPDGSFSRDPTDLSNKARGASAGLVGAVGIAIRAERIDADAARSMQESGLEHAGFYGEVSTAWVDGFGSSSKLSVGDSTFSAGINFEF
ncbi:MAG: MXAN_2562 family outer membrane beta-barrel protein [Kofleriaceae bacterium]